MIKNNNKLSSSLNKCNSLLSKTTTTTLKSSQFCLRGSSDRVQKQVGLTRELVVSFLCSLVGRIQHGKVRLYTPCDSPRVYLLPSLTVLKRALRASVLTRLTSGRVVPSHRLSVSGLGFDHLSTMSAKQRCPIYSHRCCTTACCMRTAAGLAFYESRLFRADRKN